MMGRVFSPHRLAMRGHDGTLDLRHNRVRLSQLGINVLTYGAPVEIDPGERGDFYMLLLPLQGHATTECGGRRVTLDAGTMGVLHPRQVTRMQWSGDCEMIMLEVPRLMLEDVIGAGAPGADSGPTAVIRKRAVCVLPSSSVASQSCVASRYRALATRLLNWMSRRRSKRSATWFR